MPDTPLPAIPTVPAIPGLPGLPASPPDSPVTTIPSPRTRWLLPRRILLIAILALAFLALIFQNRLRHMATGIAGHVTNATVQDRLGQYGPAARARLQPAFTATQLPYPPQRITLIGLKAERRLELWALHSGPSFSPTSSPAATANPWWHINTYPILAASGPAGPKLRQGDRMVPEGLYHIDSLNPNSFYHLSLRIDYPSADDLRDAAADGRTNLGGDIMIHGMDVSIGCLAMGDEAAEELFVLAADSGLQNIDVILAPCDFRTQPIPPPQPTDPVWLPNRYRQIADALNQYRE